MSRITKLVNPKTHSYFRLKEHVLSYDILWYYDNCVVDEKDTKNIKDKEKYVNIGVYGHAVVGRPMTYDKDHPVETYDRNAGLTPVIVDWRLLNEYINPFLYDLVCKNPSKEEFYIRSILRINLNATHNDISGTIFPHFDHPPDRLPHKNMLVYFTDAGGDTIVGDEHHTPEEDDIIVFDSEVMHCHHTPTNNKRRVVMVMTFI